MLCSLYLICSTLYEIGVHSYIRAHDEKEEGKRDIEALEIRQKGV